MKVALTALLLSSCASYLPTDSTNVKEVNGLEVATKVDEGLSTDKFTLVNFYFGNNTDEWVRMKGVRVLNYGDDQSYSIIKGQDLITWSKSIQYKKAIDDYNTQLWLDSIMVAATVSTIAINARARTSGNRTRPKIGVLALGGLATANAIRSYENELRKIQGTNFVPDDYASSSFSIPPGLVTKQWLLLMVDKKDYPCRMQVELETIDGKKVQTDINIERSWCRDGNRFTNKGY